MQPLEWTGHSLKIVDQTKLPNKRAVVELHDYREVVEAIRRLRVRGAPVIGIAAAYGIALAALALKCRSPDAFCAHLERVFGAFAASRPTAVDLFHAIERMRTALSRARSAAGARTALVAEARRIHSRQVAATVRLGRAGARLIRDGSTVLTHCNAGSLAAAGEGTALGVIRAAVRQGKKVKVVATETRPLLQGARLTACELLDEGIAVTLITDSMAGYVMSRGEIGCVVVGADRIAANGDVANKVGTYSLAVLARESGVPFYVAAPTSTFDLSVPDGKSIPIEERAATEVTTLGRRRLAPRGVAVFNPAFDVTPHRYVSAIITDRGIITRPDRRRIAVWASRAAPQ